MAMFITKFNKLIQSKIIWLLFLGVIIVTFVFWGAGPSGASSQKEQVAGKINGRKVMDNEFSRMRYHATIGRDKTVDGTQLAWERLALLDEARAQGINISDSQVQELINTFTFLKDPATGQISDATFETYAKRGLGMTKGNAFEYMRDELAIEQLTSMFSGRKDENGLAQGSQLVSSYELQLMFRDQNDQLTIDYTIITERELGDAVELSDEEIGDYFEKHKSDFSIPEQRKVRYVQIPVADFARPDDITEEQIVAAYDPEKFTKELTIDKGYQAPPRPLNSISNQVAWASGAHRIAPTALNSLSQVLAYDYWAGSESVETVVTNKTLDEARAEIATTLTESAALTAAEEHAAQVWEHLIPTSSNRNPQFAEGVKVLKGSAHTTEFFAASAKIEGVPEEDLAIFNGAFNLGNSVTERASDPVTGKDHVYILFYDSEREARVPELPEVKEEVESAALAQKKKEKLDELTESYSTKIAEAVKSGSTFEEAIGSVSTNLTVSSTAPFSISGRELQKDFMAQRLIPDILEYNQGEVTQPIAGFFGLMIAHVKERRPADLTQFSEKRDQIQAAFANRDGQLLQKNYRTFLYEKASPDKGNILVTEK